MASHDQQQQVWLVTGSSSGFGLQFVQSILARRDMVIATARSPENIRHLEAPGAKVMRLDLTDGEDSISHTIATAIHLHGRIDVLMNNAAFISTGMIEDLNAADFLAQFNTNVFGTINVTRALLPHFQSRQAGTCVFVSSLSGWVGYAGCAPYASPKFAIEGFAETRRRRRNTLVSGRNLQTKRSTIEEYAAFSEAQIEILAAEDGRQLGDPEKLASVVLGLVKGEGVAEGRAVPFRVQLGGIVWMQ